MAETAHGYHVQGPDNSSVKNLTKAPLTTSNSENENVKAQNLETKNSEIEQPEEPYQSSSHLKTDILDEPSKSCANLEQDAPTRPDQSTSNLKKDIPDKYHSNKSDKSTTNVKKESACEMNLSHANVDIALASNDGANNIRSDLKEESAGVSDDNISTKLDAKVSFKIDLNRPNQYTRSDNEPNEFMPNLEKKALNETSADPNPWCDLCYDEALEKIQACGFCPDCNSFVCKPCLTAHKKSPASRSHLIRQGTRMPKSQSDKPIKFLNCHVHNENVKSKFCLHHRKMACSECVKESHHNCKTTSIYNVCREFGSRDVIQIKETVNSILKAAIHSKEGVENNISGIENQKKVMIKSAQNLHDNLIAKTEELYSEMIAEINDVCDKKSAGLSENALALSDSVVNFEDTMSNIDKILDTTVDMNSFIRLQGILEDAGVSENAIESINKNFNEVELSFSMNPVVSTFLSECIALGNVIVKTSQTEETEELETERSSSNTSGTKDAPALQPENSKPAQQPSTSGTAKKNSASKAAEVKTEVNMQRQYHLVGEPLIVTTAEDDKPCEIGGMDVTSDGKLLVADYNNQAVKIFSADGKLLSSVLLAASVTKGVIAINDTTAVVSSYDGELFVLDISDPYSAYVQRSIHLGYWALSMARCNDSLVLTKWTEPKSVNMIDMEGHELWSVSVDHNGQRLFQKPFSITTTIMNDKITVVVSDWSQHAIMLIDASNGELIRKVDVKGKDPHGLTADCDGNVYVCYQKSKTVHVFSADFNSSKAVVSGKDLPSNPQNIAYNDNLSELLVAYYSSDRVDRIHIPGKE